MSQRQGKTRREFLKTGAAGIAGASLLGACSGPSPEPIPEATPGTTLETIRTFGRTGLRLPVVSMGSVYGIGLVRAALDRGIVHVHTSSSYSERNHERLLGEVFRDRPRDSFVIATSPDLPYRALPGQSRSLDVGTSIDADLILESIDSSLERLGLEYVDIYYLVSVAGRNAVLHEPYVRAYEKLKEQGKIRFAGIGTHSNEPEVIRAAAGSGFWDVVLTAYNFRQSHRQEVRAAIGEAATAGLGVVAMKTQAGVYWDSGRSRKINMKAALKWVLQDTNVHTTIPAFSSYTQMEEDLAVMDDLTLTPEEWRDLGYGEAAGLPGLYCQQCGRCLPQCPNGLDVPAWMRAHMYTFGHAQPGRASELLAGWSASDVPCRGCTRCTVRCALGFDVRARFLEMAQVLGSTPGHAV